MKEFKITPYMVAIACVVTIPIVYVIETGKLFTLKELAFYLLLYTPIIFISVKLAFWVTDFLERKLIPSKKK